MRDYKFDARGLFGDYGVATAPERHKHFRHGWVGVRCPFCNGTDGYHLGYSLRQGYFTCYRCGWKPVWEALAAILSVDEREAQKIARAYKVLYADEEPEQEPASILEYPTGTGSLLSPHLKYLTGRGFDPEALVREWGLLGVGPVGWPGWKWRVIAPIIYQGRPVSYQGRSISGAVQEKYRACPERLELVHHKSILYGLDKCLGDAGIIVEGITDVWRMGPGSVCGFGVKTTSAQRALLGRTFKKLIILYDTDAEGVGQNAGELLAWQLSGIIPEVYQVTLPSGDPGSLPEDDAKSLKKELLGL